MIRLSFSAHRSPTGFRSVYETDIDSAAAQTFDAGERRPLGRAPVARAKSSKVLAIHQPSPIPSDEIIGGSVANP